MLKVSCFAEKNPRLIKENKGAKCREHDWIMKVLVSAPRVVSTMSVSHKNVLEFL